MNIINGDVKAEEVIPAIEDVNVEIPENISEENLEDFDLDALLEEISKSEEIKSEEQPPSEPTFFPDKGKEEEEFIDEKLLEDLDNNFQELETELEDIKLKLNTTTNDLIESNEKVTNYGEALDVLGSHPILGPLNEKLLKGETIDIPDYLKKMINDELDSLPDMENISNAPTDVKPAPSLQEKLALAAKNMY